MNPIVLSNLTFQTLPFEMGASPRVGCVFTQRPLDFRWQTCPPMNLDKLVDEFGYQTDEIREGKFAHFNEL